MITKFFIFFIFFNLIFFEQKREKQAVGIYLSIPPLHLMNQETKQALAIQYSQMKKNPNVAVAFPNKADPTVWHISFKGSPDSVFQGGIYHIKVNLAGYPNKNPQICALHENGSFTPDAGLCISGITSGQFSPGTTVEAITTAIQSYMPEKHDRGGLGFINPVDENYAKKCKGLSLTFKCPTCGMDHSKLFK